jgi:hypothetical protein
MHYPYYLNYAYYMCTRGETSHSSILAVNVVGLDKIPIYRYIVQTALLGLRDATHEATGKRGAGREMGAGDVACRLSGPISGTT